MAGGEGVAKMGPRVRNVRTCNGLLLVWLLSKTVSRELLRARLLLLMHQRRLLHGLTHLLLKELVVRIVLFGGVRPA